jgi:hypothetical protein
MNKSIAPQVRKSVGLAILAALLCSCSSSVTRYPASASAGYRLSEANKVSDVSISLSSDAKEELKDNLKFDQDELRRHVERALSGYAVFDASKKGQIPTIEIVVTDVRVRSNFSAVMWGFMAGSDSIKGDIVIRDQAGREVDRFKVSTSYALGGFAGGQDSARLDWLYETFAKEALKEMTEGKS